MLLGIGLRSDFATVASQLRRVLALIGSSAIVWQGPEGAAVANIAALGYFLYTVLATHRKVSVHDATRRPLASRAVPADATSMRASKMLRGMLTQVVSNHAPGMPSTPVRATSAATFASGAAPQSGPCRPIVSSLAFHGPSAPLARLQFCRHAHYPLRVALAA